MTANKPQATTIITNRDSNYVSVVWKSLEVR